MITKTKTSSTKQVVYSFTPQEVQECLNDQQMLLLEAEDTRILELIEMGELVPCDERM